MLNYPKTGTSPLQRTRDNNTMHTEPRGFWKQWCLPRPGERCRLWSPWFGKRCFSRGFLVLLFIELMVIVFVMAHLRLQVLEVVSSSWANAVVKTTIGTIRLFEVSSLCV